jgi:hypothetical protein
MKKNHLLLALCAVLAFAFVAGRTFVGHWKVAYGNGAKGFVVFRKDGTNEATFTNENWKVGGRYKVEGNTVSITDSSCGLNYWASYKVNWFSDDSVQVTVIQDSCMGRKGSVDGSVMVRMK